jgi:hypothetical protein
VTTIWYIILIILAGLYFYLYKYKKNDKHTQENFTSKINGFCRPHIRNVRLKYESFINEYGNDYIIIKFKKMDFVPLFSVST